MKRKIYRSCIIVNLLLFREVCKKSQLTNAFKANVKEFQHRHRPDCTYVGLRRRCVIFCEKKLIEELLTFCLIVLVLKACGSSRQQVQAKGQFATFFCTNIGYKNCHGFPSCQVLCDAAPSDCYGGGLQKSCTYTYRQVSNCLAA